MRLLLLLSLCFFASCASDYGKSVEDKGHKLYYVEPVSEGEAKTVLDWLHEVNHNFGEPPMPFQLSKNGNTYVFKYPVGIEGAENEEGNISYIQTFASKLSEKFTPNKVEVHLTDKELKTKKVIPGN